MNDLVLYIHGKGGSADEAQHYRSAFPKCEVMGLEYTSETPREAAAELSAFADEVFPDYASVTLIANSIGVYYAMCAFSERPLKRAFSSLRSSIWSD